MNRRRQMGLSASHHSLDNIEFDNKEDDQHDQRLLSQFGIWFLVCNHRLFFLCLSITKESWDKDVYSTRCLITTLLQSGFPTTDYITSLTPRLHLQVSLCTPNENTPTESLARLVSMVFQWFHSTAYMMDDEVGSLVEKLKPQFVTKWLKTVCEVRFDVMVMCLLPKPVEFARVRPRPRSSKHTIYDERIKEDIQDESGSIMSKMYTKYQR